MALDHERVGLENVEVPSVCDFGDNVLDYMTKSGHASDKPDACDSDSDSDSISACSGSYNDSQSDSDSESSTATTNKDSNHEDRYSGIIPDKFIAFLNTTFPS